MPSWNIHTAHVERILAQPLEGLGIRSANEFMFGNLVPDIYVGYVVSPITRKIEYRDTHYADPGFIPTPNAALFYERYLKDQEADDVTLGAWTHLICDHYYNLRTIEYIASIGVEAGTQTRIRKQADFDLFGRTLSIHMVPKVNDRLLQCAVFFPQYVVEGEDVHATVRAQRAIVQKNQDEHVEGVPEYSLLTAAFFQNTFNEVDQRLNEALGLYATGGDASHIGRP